MDKELKRIEGKKFYNYKRRRGDRKDSWRVRSDDPFFGVIPHIMTQRTGSTVMYKASIDAKALDEFVRDQRRTSEMHDLTRLTVLCAALVRVFSQYPKLNRFVRGRRIWARNSLTISIIVKREMVLGGEECAIKPYFDPDDSLHEVWEKLRGQIIDNKKDTSESSGNSTAEVAKIINTLPVWLVKAFVNLLVRLDDNGKMNKFLNEVSPFHCSMFITDIGSTGIASVYHHLYDFGTCSHFISLGKREKAVTIDDSGAASEIHEICFKYVVDERIVDGYYYAKAMRYFETLLKHPERLLEKPDEVFEDDLK